MSNGFSDPILAPSRRTKWTTYNLVTRFLAAFSRGETPRSDAAEYLRALGVSHTRVTQLLNGEYVR